MRTQKVNVFSLSNGLENQSQTWYAHLCFLSFLSFINISKTMKIVRYWYWYYTYDFSQVPFTSTFHSKDVLSQSKDS